MAEAARALLDNGKTKLLTSFGEMPVVCKGLTAADGFHDNQTTAVHHAPCFVLVMPENFQRFPFDMFVNPNKIHNQP